MDQIEPYEIIDMWLFLICEMGTTQSLKRKNLLIHTTWVDHKDNTE